MKLVKALEKKKHLEEIDQQRKEKEKQREEKDMKIEELHQQTLLIHTLHVENEKTNRLLDEIKLCQKNIETKKHLKKMALQKQEREKKHEEKIASLMEKLKVKIQTNLNL